MSLNSTIGGLNALARRIGRCSDRWSRLSNGCCDPQSPRSSTGVWSDKKKITLQQHIEKDGN